MPLQKLQFRPGLNREGTDYSNEGGWYDGDKIRFRSGFPEKLGGWTRFSSNTFVGVCRALWNWVDYDANNNYVGLGTSKKYYIEKGSVFNDVTPFLINSSGSTTTTLTASPLATTSGSSIVTVTDTVSGISPNIGDYFVLTSTANVAGINLNGEYIVSKVIDETHFEFDCGYTASSTTSGGGTVTISYEYPIGNDVYTFGTGWGAGPWSPTITANLGANPFQVLAGSTTVTVTQVAHDYLTTAGAFTTGKQYKIVSIGSTDFTLIGASANTVGTVFTATGPGTGSGTASIVWVAFLGVEDVYVTPTSYGFAGTVSFPTTTNGIGFLSHSNIVAIPATLLNSTFEITYVDANTYTITIAAPAPFGAVGGGNNVVVYPEYGIRGWGAADTSGIGQQLRLWSNDNYGQDLVIAPRGGPIYYWQDSLGVTTRAQPLSLLANSTTSITDAATFGSGVTSITVTGANAPYIYPYMYITGANLPAGTQVASTYITGSTTVPITTTTTGVSSLTYNFSYAGAYVPVATNQVIASAIQEFVIAFGSNPYVPGDSGTDFNPMLVRWSDQANAYQWVPQTTNQSGEYLLTNGSFIMGARATRQEILVWTDSCIYSMQYLGAPYVWGFQVLMDNISVMSPNSMITINNVTYWMGRDRFYMYSGRVEVLPCALRQYIFDDINQDQAFQVIAGANEAYNEVWWYYCSSNSDFIDKYIVYNYLDRVWYYGSLSRTAWLQSGILPNPIATNYLPTAVFTGSISGTTLTVLNVTSGVVALDVDLTGSGVAAGTVIESYGTGTGGVGTYNLNVGQTVSATTMTSEGGYGYLLSHEVGNDDVAGLTPRPISAFVQSSDFDIGDGHNFGFVWRILPDINFNGSSSNQPTVTMTVKPRQNSGTPYGPSDNPQVQSAQNYTTVPQYTVQQFDGQVYTRLRGRQMAFRIESADIGVAWQLGSPRIDIRPDGRR